MTETVILALALMGLALIISFLFARSAAKTYSPNRAVAAWVAGCCAIVLALVALVNTVPWERSFYMTTRQSDALEHCAANPSCDPGELYNTYVEAWRSSGGT
jgi:hypothetical protein